MASLLLGLLLVPLAGGGIGEADQGERLARTYAKAVDAINAEHARKPLRTEEELAASLPAKAEKALERLLGMKESEAVAPALVRCGESALGIDRLEDFERIRRRLLEVSPKQAAELGVALSRPRFQLRGLGGLDLEYLKGFAEVFDAVLDGYDETFGFEEWSKVPNKKLRVRVHLEERITTSPHFAPQFPYHSEIDFPVDDPEAFRSPTPDGKFLFFGLCHELGHVVAMWGDRSKQEDHHAWADYTGAVVCQHLSERDAEAPYMQLIRDVRWRSFDRLAKEHGATQPAFFSREGVLAFFVALHGAVGPGAVGASINHLDRENRRLRIGRVRYYTFRELERGLLATLEDRAQKRRVEALFPD